MSLESPSILFPPPPSTLLTLSPTPPSRPNELQSGQTILHFVVFSANTARGVPPVLQGLICSTSLRSFYLKHALCFIRHRRYFRDEDHRNNDDGSEGNNKDKVSDEA